MRDLWAEWDDDLNGKVDTKEFYRALTLLGLKPSRAESDELFKRFDTDGSGTIEFEELKKALHRTGSVEIDAVLRAGAVAFEREAKNRFATRKNGPGKTARAQQCTRSRTAFRALFSSHLTEACSLCVAQARRARMCSTASSSRAAAELGT